MNGNGITLKIYRYGTEFKFLKYDLICTNSKEILLVQYIPTIIQSGCDLVIGFGISPLAAYKKKFKYLGDTISFTFTAMHSYD